MERQVEQFFVDLTFGQLRALPADAHRFADTAPG